LRFRPGPWCEPCGGQDRPAHRRPRTYQWAQVRAVSFSVIRRCRSLASRTPPHVRTTPRSGYRGTVALSGNGRLQFFSVKATDPARQRPGSGFERLDSISFVFCHGGIPLCASSSPSGRVRTAQRRRRRRPGDRKGLYSLRISDSPANLSGPWRGRGLSGRRALLPWGLCWLNCRNLLSACERLLQDFEFTG